MVGPREVLAEAGVLLLEGDVGDGAGVGADAEGDAVAVQPIDAVFGITGHSAGLHVAAGTDFEMNAPVAEMLHECGVFDAAHTVADAGWLEELECLPYAAGAACFAGMGGAVKAVIDSVAIGRNVRIDGESGFVACDVEGGDAGARKLLDEMHGLEALFGAEMAEGAENEPRFDAGGADALFGGAIDG